MIRTYLITFFLFFSFFALGQELLPLSKEYITPTYSKIYSTKSTIHTSIKPLRKDKLNKHFDFDSLQNFNKGKYRSKFMQLLCEEHLIKVDTGIFKLNIDPLFDLTGFKEKNNDENLYNNTRGFLIQGNITDKFYFYSDFYENQSIFPSHIQDFTNTYSIVPGQGLTKVFKETGVDYAHASGQISYSPSDIFNFRFGHGKVFVGDGYRSLLLSDNAFNYPHLTVSTNIWKIQYTNIYAVFMDMMQPHTYEAGYHKKNASFHHFSINATKNLQVYLFEGIIWQHADSTGRRGFDLNYLNPVIFYRPVEFSLASPDNAIVGAGFHYKFFNKLLLYGQMVLDDFDLGASKGTTGHIRNKLGGQVGIRVFDFPLKGLNSLIEYNRVKPYTYAHKSPAQNYTHYNQALAHPLGANFHELVGKLSYRFKNQFVLNLKGIYAQYGIDTAGIHYGRNIFLSDKDAAFGLHGNGNELLQGLKTTLKYIDINFSYIINPITNMQLTLGMVLREESSIFFSNNTSHVYFGFRTRLQNRYYDF